MAKDETERFRNRAYELADTGRFDDGFAVAAALEQEGFARAIARVRGDWLLQRMLKARCDQAKERG